MNKQELLKEYIKYDDFVIHAPYNDEKEFYLAILEGNVDEVNELLKKELSQKKGLGILSKNKIKNYQYHFAINAALIARYCISGGMDVVTAFNLSDFYINKADECKSIEDISKLNSIMSIDYAKKMREIKKKKIFSRQIIKCIEYIYNHLHEKISVDDLAKEVELTSNYLSRLFKKETGKTITNYIIDLKIDTAKRMLLYSSYDISEIVYLLAFPSQSYFTEVFRKKVGETPLKYKNSVSNGLF